MRKRLPATLALSLALGGCAGALSGCRSWSAHGDPSTEAAQVREQVGRRTGTSVPAQLAGPAVPDTCPIDPRARILLREPLTDEAAVKIALLNNRSVQEAYERLGIAKADLLQAGLLSNPVFSANAKFFARGPEVEVGLAQSFLDLFYIPMRRRVARADLCATQAVVTRDLVRLVYDIRRAVVLERAAGGLVELSREALRTAEASRDLTGKLHEAGNILDSDLTVEEVGAARAALDLRSAEVLAREAAEEINVLLGLRGDGARWTLDGSLGELPAVEEPGDVESRALAASLDLLENRARIESALWSAGLARRQGLLPRLDLGPVAKRENSGGWGAGPEVTTALPLFDQGQARFITAHAVLRQRHARHAQMSVEVASAARRFRDRSAALDARATYLREAYLPLRARLVRETLQRYNAMQIGAPEVLDVKRDEVDARREYLGNLRDAWVARLDLQELLAGSLNPSRVEAVLPPQPAEHPSTAKGH